jgi:hypothetical protein
MITHQPTDHERMGPFVSLRSADGKGLLFINVEERLTFLYTTGTEECHQVHFESLEKFALELTRALGHDWDKTIR